MTTPKLHLVTHMGHDGPWLLIKTAKEIRKRRAHIRTKKPEHERALRLRRLQVVKAPLPPQLAHPYAAWDQANAAWYKARAAWNKASAARDKARVAWYKAYAARDNASAARDKARAAWNKASAARDKARAAWNKASAARVTASAAWYKARAAWNEAINSPEGVKFHAQVCGCAWTPEQPDILRQLEQTL